MHQPADRPAGWTFTCAICAEEDIAADQLLPRPQCAPTCRDNDAKRVCIPCQQRFDAAGLAKAQKCVFCNQPLLDSDGHKWLLEMKVNHQACFWEFDTRQEAQAEANRLRDLVDNLAGGNNYLRRHGDIVIEEVSFQPSTPEDCEDVRPEQIIAEFLDEHCKVLMVCFCDLNRGLNHKSTARLPEHAYNTMHGAEAAKAELEAYCERVGFPLHRVELHIVHRDAEASDEHAIDVVKASRFVLLDTFVKDEFLTNEFVNRTEGEAVDNELACVEKYGVGVNIQRTLRRRQWVTVAHLNTLRFDTVLEWVEAFMKPQTLDQWLRLVNETYEYKNGYTRSNATVALDRQGLTMCIYGKGGTVQLPETLKPMTMRQYQTTFQWWFDTADVRIQVGKLCWQFEVSKLDIPNSDACLTDEFYMAHHVFRPFPVKRNTPKRKRRKTLLAGQQTISQFFRPAKKARHDSDSF